MPPFLTSRFFTEGSPVSGPIAGGRSNEVRKSLKAWEKDRPWSDDDLRHWLRHRRLGREFSESQRCRRNSGSLQGVSENFRGILGIPNNTYRPI